MIDKSWPGKLEQGTRSTLTTYIVRIFLNVLLFHDAGGLFGILLIGLFLVIYSMRFGSRGVLWIDHILTSKRVGVGCVNGVATCPGDARTVIPGVGRCRCIRLP